MGKMRLCGCLSQWFSRFVPPPTMFQGPLHSAARPLSTDAPNQVGPSLFFALLPFPPTSPKSPHHIQSRASSCSVQAVITSPYFRIVQSMLLIRHAFHPDE